MVDERSDFDEVAGVVNVFAAQLQQVAVLAVVVQLEEIVALGRELCKHRSEHQHIDAFARAGLARLLHREDNAHAVALATAAAVGFHAGGGVSIEDRFPELDVALQVEHFATCVLGVAFGIEGFDVCIELIALFH